MRVFLNTNVVIDFLGERDDFFNDAALIFQMQKDGNLDILVSSLTIVNCAYILGKIFSKEIVLSKIVKLCESFSISEINKADIVSALKSDSYDFEDAVQYYSSLPYNPDVIISRDKKGFSSATIPVMTPADFIAECKR